MSAPSTRRRREERLTVIGHELLCALGYDPTTPALRATPRRWARMWTEFIDYEDRNTDTTFDNVHQQQTDQLVLVRGVRVWSMCEHHLLPFWCDLTMAYIPATKLLGLSKFGRIARLVASRLQVQERIVADIAAHLIRVTGTENVAVLAEGEHLCMTMRGPRAPHRMTGSLLRGAFKDHGPAREELLLLAQGLGGGHLS